jgi:hypothetical protein
MAKYFEKLIITEEGNPAFEIYFDGKLSKTETPEERGLFKQKEFCYLFTRTALNPQTMKNISAPFLQKISYKVPNKDGFDFMWLFWERGMLPHVKALDARLGRLAGFCYAIIPSDANYVKKTAAPKKLTNIQAAKIMKEGVYEGIPCLGVFGEDNGSEAVPAKTS